MAHHMVGRFVILADIHLGLVGPQPDGNTYGDVAFLLERAVQQVRELQPQRIILLGDLVNRGFDSEYDALRSALGPLLDRCVPILGNHELQRASIADFERKMNTRAVRTETVCGLAAIILSSGIEGLPDTEWQGRIDDRQLDWLDERLPSLPDGPLLVFVHHPIAGTVRDSAQPMLGLTNACDLQARLERHAGPVIVFSAHTHAQSFVRRGRFSYVGAPPLGFWPHALLVVDVQGKMMDFRTIRLVDRPEESPDGNALMPAYRAAREGAPSDGTGTIPLQSIE